MQVNVNLQLNRLWGEIREQNEKIKELSDEIKKLKGEPVEGNSHSYSNSYFKQSPEGEYDYYHD